MVAPVHRKLAKCGDGPKFQFYLSPRALREAVRGGWGVPEGKPVVALMCLSWFAFLRVAEAASVRAADVWGDKALGFWVTKPGRVGCRRRIWSKWSRVWGDFLRDWTKWWDPEAPVVPGGALVLEAAMAYYLKGTEWAEGRWHGHRRGGDAAWVRGPPQAWFLFWGRWEDKATAMGYAKDLQDPWVLEDLLLLWPEKGGALEFRELSASQVWSGAVFANDRLRDSGGRGRGVATPDVPTSPPKPRRAEGGEWGQAKGTCGRQVRPTDPLRGRGKRKEASEKLVTSEATTTSGEESSSSAESPPGEAVAPAGLGKGGGEDC